MCFVEARSFSVPAILGSDGYPLSWRAGRDLGMAVRMCLNRDERWGMGAGSSIKGSSVLLRCHLASKLWSYISLSHLADVLP